MNLHQIPLCHPPNLHVKGDLTVVTQSARVGCQQHKQLIGVHDSHVTNVLPISPNFKERLGGRKNTKNTEHYQNTHSIISLPVCEKNWKLLEFYNEGG